MFNLPSKKDIEKISFEVLKNKNHLSAALESCRNEYILFPFIQHAFHQLQFLLLRLQ